MTTYHRPTVAERNALIAEADTYRSQLLATEIALLEAKQETASAQARLESLYSLAIGESEKVEELRRELDDMTSAYRAMRRTAHAYSLDLAEVMAERRRFVSALLA